MVWIGLALLFGFGFYQYSLNKFTLEGLANAEQLSRQLTLEYYTGFIVEKALAIDNIFVFVVIFNFFSIPLKYQHKILFYGPTLGALFFRAIFIALGSILMQYHTLVLIFGVFLILTGIKIIFSPDKEIDPSENIVLKWLTKRFPITSEIEGDKFIVRKSGKTYITPLLLALAFVEFSDIIFAVDSVPAIFAITKEPFIVFTSNIFAILGWNSLFILAGVVDKFHLLKYGLGIVLVFVGLKMSYLNELFDGKFPISWSLIIISFLISVSIILSLTFPKKEKILNN